MTMTETAAPAPIPGERTLLIVEDDKSFLTRLARAMEARGFEVATAESVAEFSRYIPVSHASILADRNVKDPLSDRTTAPLRFQSSPRRMCDPVAVRPFPHTGVISRSDRSSSRPRSSALQSGARLLGLLGLHGPVAQSGERRPRMAEARGSSPLGSTLFFRIFAGKTRRARQDAGML